MSSLWTPGGERPVGPDPASGARSGPDSEEELRRAAATLGLDPDTLTEEERDELRTGLAEMRRFRREVAATPAPEMLATHLTRFFDLVVIYLQADPPAFEDAATVIEAFRAVLDAIGERFGEHCPLLQQTLAQAQMLFVQVKEATRSDGPGTGG